MDNWIFFPAAKVMQIFQKSTKKNEELIAKERKKTITFAAKL
jgi:hypothetical protein